MFLARIAALISPSAKEATAWGGGSVTRYHDKSDKEEKDAYQQAMEALKYKRKKDEEDGSDDEDEPAPKYAPEELQEGLKTIVNKSRSKHEREGAIPKISDQTFLFQVIMNEKQSADVRRTAAEYLKDQTLLEKVAEMDASVGEGKWGGKSIKTEAIKNLKDMKLVEKYAREGFTEALERITNEDLLANLYVEYLTDKFGKNKLSQYDLKVHQFKNDKNLAKIVDGIVNRKGDRAKPSDYELTLMEIVRKTKDPKTLAKIAVLEQDEDDGYNPFQSAAIIKLADKALAKKLATDPKQNKNTRYVALKVADDSILYEKAFIADPKFTEALDHIDNDELLKKTANELFKKAKGKVGREDYDMRRAIPKILSKVKDQEYLKTLVNKLGGWATDALTGITDQEYLKDLWNRKKTGEKALENLPLAAILERITDQKILEEAYGEAQQKFIEKYQKHQADQVGAYQKQRFRSEEDPSSSERLAVLHNIKDQDFLYNVYKKDKNADVRQTALGLLKDTKLLADIFKKEKRKGEKFLLLDALGKNEDLMLELLADEMDEEVSSGIAGKIKSPEKVKKYLLGDDPDMNIWRKMIDIVVDDQPFLKKLLKTDDLPNKYKDFIIEHIEDEDFVEAYVLNQKDRLKKDEYNSLIRDVLEKTKNKAFLKEFAMSDSIWSAREAFDRLMEDADVATMTELATKAKTPEVRKKALPHVTDLKLLKKIALTDPEIAINILPKFKDDPEFLTKLLLESKDPKVRANLVRRVKDEKALKEIAKRDKLLAPLALEGIKDEAYLREILNHTQVEEVARSILANPNLSLKDVEDFFHTSQFDFVDSSYRSGDEIFETAFKRLLDANMVDKAFLEKGVNLNKARIMEKFLEMLAEHNRKDLLEYWAEAKDLPSALEAFKKVRTPEFAAKMLKDAASEEVRRAAVLWIPAADLKPEQVNDLIMAMDETDEPNAVSKDLLHKAYTIGTEEEQDLLAKRLPDRLLNERHKGELEEEEHHYLKPRTSYKEQKGVIKKHDHSVVEIPQQELLRALVRLAR